MVVGRPGFEAGLDRVEDAPLAALGDEVVVGGAGAGELRDPDLRERGLGELAESPDPGLVPTRPVAQAIEGDVVPVGQQGRRVDGDVQPVEGAVGEVQDPAGRQVLAV